MSVWTVASVAALAGVATLLFLHRGDAEGSARVVNREIEAQLQQGETVERRVSVQRRRWFDYFRVTHGVLAATDRRLIYIGVPPEELIPREPEPLELDQLIVPYDRPIVVTLGRVFFGTLPGLTITAGGRSDSFGVTTLDREKVDGVISVLTRRQGELRAAAEAERKALEAAVAASRRAITHLVQRGEALEFIAQRYGTTVDSLRRWNALTTDRITAGRRLIVRPAR
ncbi:MAG: LysM peptidoglycan-binding domain-containing protein [Gemmatimonadaceae bacterium]